MKDGLEIQARIRELNNEIREFFQENIFTLNHKVKAAEDEIKSLQEICPHVWERGVCIYCGRTENGS